jgi:hypothetical protein
MGLFWGLALLTKYTALVAWLGSTAAALMWLPAARLDRRYWIGQAIALALFAPWLAVRFRFEGWTVVRFWESRLGEWAILAGFLKWWWVVPLLVVLSVVARRVMDAPLIRGLLTSPTIMLIGTAVAVSAVLLIGHLSTFVDLPWTGWNENQLSQSPWSFYLTRQIVFEPIVIWGIVGFVLLRETDWKVVRLTWLALLVFLSVWGNYQSRYGLPLLPFEHVMAMGVFSALIFRRPSKHRSWIRNAAIATGVVWIALSTARSLKILRHLAMPSDFFYF